MSHTFAARTTLCIAGPERLPSAAPTQRPNQVVLCTEPPPEPRPAVPRFKLQGGRSRQEQLNPTTTGLSAGPPARLGVCWGAPLPATAVTAAHPVSERIHSLWYPASTVAPGTHRAPRLMQSPDEKVVCDACGLPEDIADDLLPCSRCPAAHHFHCSGYCEPLFPPPPPPALLFANLTAPHK